MISLTLAIVTSVAILLPGFFAILLWNARSRRYAVARPDLPINALSVMAIGVAVSLAAHMIVGGVIHILQTLLIDLSAHLPTFVPRYTAVNPVVALAVIVQGGEAAKTMGAYQLSMGFLSPLLSTFAVIGFMNDDAIDVATEGWDFGGHGWAYSHITRPSQHGHRPIAFVLTELQHEGLGVGYRGVVADIRQSSDGQTQSISLVSPSRFLYEIQAGTKSRWHGDEEPALVRYPERPIGDVINLDQKVIHDIVISAPSRDVLHELLDLEDQRSAAGDPGDGE